MTRYKTRTGVILTEIAGEYVLVAAKALQEICPYVTQINETSAFLWRQLENGASSEQLKQALESEFEIGAEIQLEPIVRDYLCQMKELGYLLVEEEVE